MRTNQILSALAWAFCWGFLILGGTYAQAQTVIATKCYTPPANTASFDNNFGALVGGIDFVAGVDIPAGYKIADMEIQVTWSKTLGTCAAPVAGAVDVSEVGFGLQDPTGATLYFAPSNVFAAFVPTPSGTFSGTGQVLNVTTTFKASQLTNPATFPMTAATGTYRFNNSQPFPTLLGASPFGGTGWSLVAIDDAPASTGVLCIQSYCIKIYACPGNPVDAVCKTGTINLPLAPNGIRNLAFADLNNGSDTACLLKSVVFTPSSFNCAALGQPASVVKMVLTDAIGGRDSCTATVSVVDTTRPIALCRNITVPLTNAGTATVQATAINNSSSDQCGIASMSINGMSTQTYNCANVGVNNAVLRVADVSGNQSTCSANITIIDTTAPNVTCKNYTLKINNLGVASMNANDSIIASDACGFVLRRFQFITGIGGSPIGGQMSTLTVSCGNIGTTPLRLIAIDMSGNVGTCDVNLTLLDTIPPTAICKTAVTAFLNPTGQAVVNAVNLDNGSTEVCPPIGSYQINGAAFQNYTCAHLGNNSATLAVYDIRGNFSTCTATVSVVDTTRPIALCRNITVPLTNAGTATVQATAINNSSSDECGIASMSINGMPTQTYNCANVGANNVVLRVVDVSGNQSTCSAIVTVMDTTPPVVVCKNISVCLNLAGNITLPASAICDISNDNCGINSYRINGQPSVVYSTTNIGQNTANLTVLDISGNQRSCLATISVVAANSLNCTPISNSNVVGNVYYDHNNNCSQNTGVDVAASSGILVRATNTQNPNQIYTTYTYSNGGYEFVLPLGEYNIQAQPNANGYYAACAPAHITVSSLSTAIVQQLGLQPLRLCPLLKVEIDASWLRPCNISSYNVLYENIGTQTANNAYVDITFDPFLTYISNTANISATNLGNNKYRFPLGNLGINQQSNFRAMVSVSCGATLGQVHCTAAHIYPDSVCGLNWNGPIIQILDTCMRDSVVFRLVNSGTNMLAAQTYSVVEDNLIYRPDMAFQLPAGGSLNVNIPTRPNRTYRIEVRQAPNYPALLGDSLAWGIIQNCNGISNTPASNPNLFNTQNAALAISTDCTPNSGSYDPNQKSAQQIGYGSQHFINANTPLEYKIEFQNTGTDTAFSVVILDTLDTNVLDPANIQIGTSSHAFTWSLLQNNILKFTFDSIQLVDSFTNEPLSRGYVTFHIAQQPNLATNTVINNKAAIYFDANAPVITNTCFHTIGDNFVQRVAVSVGEVLNKNISVKAYPNPFQTETTLEVIGAENQALTLRIVDAMGKIVQTQESQEATLRIHRENLPTGVYFYQLFANGQLLNTGKLIAE